VPSYKAIGAIGAEIFEIEISQFCLCHRLEMLFLAHFGLDIPYFPKISKNYLGTSYKAVTTALGPRF